MDREIICALAMACAGQACFFQIRHHDRFNVKPAINIEAKDAHAPVQ
jgi:hypothetical protein